MAAQWVYVRCNDIEATQLTFSQWPPMYYCGPPWYWGAPPTGLWQLVQPPAGWTAHPPPPLLTWAHSPYGYYLQYVDSQPQLFGSDGGALASHGTLDTVGQPD
jgi:hypothetical protein